MMPLVLPSNQNLSVAGMVLVHSFCQQDCNPKSVLVVVLRPQWSHCGLHGMLKNFDYEEIIGMFILIIKKLTKMFQRVSRLTSFFFHSGWFFKNSEYFIKYGLFYNFLIIPVSFLLFNFQGFNIFFFFFLNISFASCTA